MESNEIETVLENKELVNIPNISCHSMLVDSKENVWIVEPGSSIQKHPHTDPPLIFCAITKQSTIFTHLECLTTPLTIEGVAS